MMHSQALRRSAPHQLSLRLPGRRQPRVARQLLSRPAALGGARPGLCRMHCAADTAVRVDPPPHLSCQSFDCQELSLAGSDSEKKGAGIAREEEPEE